MYKICMEYQWNRLYFAHNKYKCNWIAVSSLKIWRINIDWVYSMKYMKRYEALWLFKFINAGRIFYTIYASCYPVYIEYKVVLTNRFSIAPPKYCSSDLKTCRCKIFCQNLRSMHDLENGFCMEGTILVKKLRCSLWKPYISPPANQSHIPTTSIPIDISLIKKVDCQSIRKLNFCSRNSALKSLAEGWLRSHIIRSDRDFRISWSSLW